MAGIGARVLQVGGNPRGCAEIARSIVAAAAVETVCAGAAVENVIAATAEEAVIAGAAADPVVAAIATQGIVEVGAPQVLDADIAVARGMAGIGARVLQVGGDPGPGAVVAGGVAAAAAVQHIAARAALQYVIATPAEQRVVAEAAEQDVPAGAAGERIRTRSAVHDHRLGFRADGIDGAGVVAIEQEVHDPNPRVLAGIQGRVDGVGGADQAARQAGEFGIDGQLVGAGVLCRGDRAAGRVAVDVEGKAGTVDDQQRAVGVLQHQPGAGLGNRISIEIDDITDPGDARMGGEVCLAGHGSLSLARSSCRTLFSRAFVHWAGDGRIEPFRYGAGTPVPRHPHGCPSPPEVTMHASRSTVFRMRTDVHRHVPSPARPLR